MQVFDDGGVVESVGLALCKQNIVDGLLHEGKDFLCIFLQGLGAPSALADRISNGGQFIPERPFKHLPFIHATPSFLSHLPSQLIRQSRQTLHPRPATLDAFLALLSPHVQLLQDGMLENVEGGIVVLALPLPLPLAGFLDEVLVGGLLLAVVGVHLVLGVLVGIVIVALFGFLSSGKALEAALDADEKAVILVEGREGESEGRLHQPHPHALLAFLPSHHLRVDLQVPPRKAKTQRHLLHPLDCA